MSWIELEERGSTHRMLQTGSFKAASVTKALSGFFFFHVLEATRQHVGQPDQTPETSCEIQEPCGMRWAHEVFLSRCARHVSSQEHTVSCTR